MPLRGTNKYTKKEIQELYDKAIAPNIWNKGLRTPFDYTRGEQPLSDDRQSASDDSTRSSVDPSNAQEHALPLALTNSLKQEPFIKPFTNNAQLSAQGYVPHTELYSGLWSNINQGLTGASRDILATYWQQTINHLETETHDFKIHQLPLARIKKVMKADPEVKMISAEAPILFAKGCDIFITELTMRAWIHAEDNKRRTLQRSDIAAALGKSDMFDFLIDIVPREESGAHGGGSKRPNTSGGQTASQAVVTQPAQPQPQPQQPTMAPPDYGQMHHGMPQDQQYRQPGMGYPGHMGGDGQQDPTQQYGQPQLFSGQDMYNPYAAGQNFGGQVSE